MGPKWTSRPFALFVVVDVDQKTINQVLKSAQSGTSTLDFWLATDNYDDAPQKQGNKVNLGTPPPILEDFKSPFVGKKLDDIATWLKAKPDDADLEPHYFAVLDQRAVEDCSVVVCKIGDKDLKGDELSFFRYPAREASTFLLGMEYGEWEELREGANKKPFAEIEYGE